MRPNWSTAPDWAYFAAQELSGSWYWHELSPRYQELTGEWVSKGRRQIVPRVSVMAKDTLEVRPGYVDATGLRKMVEAGSAQQE